MNTKKIKIVVLFLLGFGLLTAQAQEAVTAAGGNASGSGGTVSFSIGQVFYNTNIGTTGSVIEGVQQPFEISTVRIIDASIDISLKAYPNPTTNFLTLETGNVSYETLSYQLFDLHGRLIESKRITNATEIIRMENLPSAPYFLRVTKNNKEVKTFKIIKN